MEAVQLRVNAPQVIHEMIDGEVIIINLASGNYYSAKGSGADVWDVIQESPGRTQSEVVAAVAARYELPLGEIEVHVARFLDELRAEGLVAGDAGPGQPAPALSSGGINGHGRDRTFEPPVLEKFTDLQDLVLLDPVHEVDATGWPQPRPDDSAVSEPPSVARRSSS
jgi:hypothetical protein